MFLSAGAGRKEIRPAGTCGTSDTAGAGARRITHVMLYTGGDGLIESRWAAGRTLRCTFAERFGRPLAELTAGALVTDQTFPQPRRRRVFFGSFL